MVILSDFSLLFCIHHGTFLVNVSNTNLAWGSITCVQHVPKTNGDVPAQEVASEDHQLLLDR